MGNSHTSRNGFQNSAEVILSQSEEAAGQLWSHTMDRQLAGGRTSQLHPKNLVKSSMSLLCKQPWKQPRKTLHHGWTLCQMSAQVILLAVIRRDPHCLKLGVSDKAVWGLNLEAYPIICSSCSSAQQLSQHDYENKSWYNDSETLHGTLQGKVLSNPKTKTWPKKKSEEIDPHVEWDKKPGCTMAIQVIKLVTFMSSASLQECHSAFRAFQVTALQPQSWMRFRERACSAMKPEWLCFYYHKLSLLWCKAFRLKQQKRSTVKTPIHGNCGIT